MVPVARRIRLLAWFHIVVSGVGLLAGFALCVNLAMSSALTIESPAGALFLPMLFWVTAVYLGPGMAGGIGLLSKRPWGAS